VSLKGSVDAIQLIPLSEYATTLVPNSTHTNLPDNGLHVDLHQVFDDGIDVAVQLVPLSEYAAVEL
jgi:hypothetical protein